MTFRIRERYTFAIVATAILMAVAIATMLHFTFGRTTDALRDSSSAAMSTALLRQLEVRGRDLVATLTAGLVDPVLLHDIEAIYNLARAVQTVSDVDYVLIYDDAGVVVQDGTSQMRAFGQAAPEPLARTVLSQGQWLVSPRDHMLEIAGPITVGDEIIGAVSIGFALDEIDADIRNLDAELGAVTAASRKGAIFAGLAITFGLGAVGALIGFYVSRRLSRPIEDLTAATRGIADSNYDVSFPWRRNDELGELATAMKTMADRLRETTVSKIYLKNIVGSMVDGLIVVAPSGEVRSANRAACELTGYSEDELIGLSLAELFDGDERRRFDAEVLPVLARDRRWRGEATGRRRDGSTFEQETSLTALDDDSGLVCVVRDISERKSTEDDRNRLRDQFHQAQKMEAVGRLAGGIAHDFNNILATMLGYGGFLVDNLPAGSEQRSFAEQIVKAGNRAKDLIKQILVFSRRQDTSHQDIDLKTVLAETVGLLRAVLPTSIELRERIAEGAATARADPTQIGQVIMNLCVNAKDAIGTANGCIDIDLDTIESGGEWPQDMTAAGAGGSGAAAVRISAAGADITRMWIGAVDPGRRYARLRISDTGCGMDRAVMEQMFDPFFTSKSVGKGTGLGLAAVHGLVAAHGGAIAVESAPGKGASFEVYLPSCVAPAAVADPGDAGRKPAGSERVLVVDDEEQVAAMLARSLERLGYKTACCATAAEALEALAWAEQPWELIITDQMMPQMTGSELIAVVRACHPDLPVILCSGFSEVVDEASAAAAGAVAFLPKPVDDMALARAVRDALDARKQDAAA